MDIIDKGRIYLRYLDIIDKCEIYMGYFFLKRDKQDIY